MFTTTAGAALYREALDAVKPQLVLVEEAGEVLEAHVLTSLTPATRRLVLIGDHQQLRPKASAHFVSRNLGAWSGHPDYEKIRDQTTATREFIVRLAGLVIRALAPWPWRKRV